MLAERVATWPDMYMKRGMLQGLEKGRAEGEAKGRAEGRAEGRTFTLAGNVRSLMRTLGKTAEEAMVLLQVPEEDKATVLDLLAQQEARQQ